MNRYFFECFVEQIYHFEALDNELLKKLEPGKNVVFATLSDDNNDDNNDDKDKEDKSSTYKNQVLVKFENKKIGVLSVEDSNKMLPFLYEGWTDLFSGKICSVYDKDDENKRIKIVVYINKR